MAKTVAQKLIAGHLAEGEMSAGSEIALTIDQALVQDATGTLVMLTLEALGLDRSHCERAVQYVDHNLLQEDSKNPDDHLFLDSAARRFGLWFSPPGNGVSHPLHMAQFGVPGKSLIGSDSHTPASGALGMLALGAGGIDVAMAIAGEPYRIPMPEIWGIRLVGRLPDWVSAKDVILELLRRHGVSGGLNRIIEYSGPGLETLSAMDRHVMANMGTELGATTSVFPSDEAARDFMRAHEREDEWRELKADDDATYDIEEEIDLSGIEPMIAKPSSPGNVVPVSDIAGAPIYQSYIGSSANPGYRDFAIAAEIVRGNRTARTVSLDINPTSSMLLEGLARNGYLSALFNAGARLHQAGCNGCIGMGQAPATGRNSLRTVPRNFPGRSGTIEDCVFLCSPETAAASALTGRITDPRDRDRPQPEIDMAGERLAAPSMFREPPEPEEARSIELVKGPNIASLPDFESLPDRLELPVILKVGDDLSTDEIMPAGSEVLPFRSNIPKIAQFVFRDVDPDYPDHAESLKDQDGHAIVAGANYGQGSSREHAALAPRYLGLRAVIAQSFARIHHQNLVNYGVLPLRTDDPGSLDSGTVLVFEDLRKTVRNRERCTAITGDGDKVGYALEASPHEREILLRGGLINWRRSRDTEFQTS